MVKNLPAMHETWVQSLGWEEPQEEGMASACNVGDLGSIPGLGRAPGGGHGICLQCRRPGFNPWVGKSPWRRA